MSEPAINLDLMQTLFAHMAGRVRYRLGAKPASLTADSHTITRLDCSGFVRYILARASAQSLILPDGSWHQQRWCEEHLRRLAQYRDVRYAAEDPGRLFIAFLPASALRRGSPGHVWLLCSGRTLESYGGVGVGSRPWDTPALLKHAHAAYALPVER